MYYYVVVKNQPPFARESERERERESCARAFMSGGAEVRRIVWRCDLNDPARGRVGTAHSAAGPHKPSSANNVRKGAQMQPRRYVYTKRIAMQEGV